MKNLLLLGASVALMSAPALAQQPCGTGSSTTTFAGGNGQAGNMFDIHVGAADMTLCGMDLNLSAAGAGYTIEVYYRTGTSSGNTSSAGWTLLATVPNVTGAGINLPSYVDLSLDPGYVSPTFAAGQTYGLYVQNASYPTPGHMRYTNGVGVGGMYTGGTHCDIEGQYGVVLNFGGTFYPRDFNGTLYTDSAGPSGPSLAATGTCPGSYQFNLSGLTASSPFAVIAGVAGTSVLPGQAGACAGQTLGLDFNLSGGPYYVAGVSDINGDGMASSPVPAGACGTVSVIGYDLAACAETNIEAL